MLNQTVLVGRLVKEPELKELDNGQKVTNITLAVPRSYKNSNGEYETDFIDCVLWNGVAEKTTEFCKKGDVIGVKGKIETSLYENSKGETKKSTQIIAEKVSFLSSAKEKEDKSESKNEDLEM